MASPAPTTAVFSVRVVSLDYYMAPPIPDLDLCYSPFHGGGKVQEVPVIRIYGSTPAGQKTCLHVHRALPYLYIPCPNELLQNPGEGNLGINALLIAAEKALKDRSASKKHHVHGCTLVRAKKLYGYHSTEELFVKIYLYYPHEVGRLATLLLGGAVLNRIIQPYESHIPYLLHFLVDYNLYGMSHIHVSNVKFRPPLPDSFKSQISCCTAQSIELEEKPTSVSSSLQADSDSDAVGKQAIWISSTIPSALIWKDLADGLDARETTKVGLVKRQSTSMLEADSSVDDILNEKCKIYTSLSQTTSDVKMVQSLIPIWEEFERSGMQEAGKLPDLGKPQPRDVLRSFLCGIGYESALAELFSKEETSFQNVSFVEKAEKLENHIKALTKIAGADKLREHGSASNIHDGTLQFTEERKEDTLSATSSSQETHQTIPCKTTIEMASTSHQASSSQILEAQNLKGMDTEMLALLSWLASSQAAEDLNSDDELTSEAILSPLFPIKSYKVALETAHLDYENASQQECQDILDTIEGAIRSEVRKEDSASSGDTIPQVDGSSDENNRACQGGDRNNEKSPFYQAGTCKSTKQASKRGRDKLPWGPLPLYFRKKQHGDMKPDAVESSPSKSNTSSVSEGERSCSASVESATIEPSGGAIGKALTACSVRDLMRRKRCFQPDQSESESSRVNIVGNVKMTDMVGLSSMKVDFISDVDSRVLHVEERAASSAACNEEVCLSHTFCPEETNLHNVVTCTSNRTADLPLAGNCGTKFCNVLGASSANGDYMASTSCPVKNASVPCIQMTFTRKPPTRDQVGTSFDDSLGTLGCGDDRLVLNSSFWSARQGLSDLLPFHNNSIENSKHYKSKQNEESYSFQESALGVPTHFQNDGSALYMLTHAFLPPTSESIDQWLREEAEKACSDDGCGVSDSSILFSDRDPSSKSRDGLGNSREGFDSPFREKVSCFSQDSLGKSSGNASPKFKTSVHLEPDGPDLPKSGDGNCIDQFEDCRVGVDATTSESKLAGVQMKQNTLVDSWHDFSQISGPDEKSKLTPLSQIGFCDPASAGGGQQLTIMSIEVLADCRGDLRPNPQFDAINVISLAVEEDTRSGIEVYVLMRGNGDEFCRNVDGVSGCNAIIFSEEKHLLDHLVDTISSIDPDILMGWEIQGGSLGFLAERAAHLGVSLLKRISRTPTSEIKDKAKHSADAEVCNHLPEASLTDAVLEGLYEDDWGRAHASGIHVGGRIVLNLWRLMRAEVKLNMYNVETVAEEVLRRKIPSISCKILNQWFLSGPGRARFRSIQYVTERAILNLQIMNQLDMINRTSELARVFGIDFFSVLSRGSQFRVESMLLRLAHTQNYVAISPGSQQVASQPAMECLPLVMEPESAFYTDPVVVLDFQSLYPSMIIAYNLCFSTCLGKVVPSMSNVLGVSSYSPDPCVLLDLKDQLLLAPNGVIYVPPKVRKGVLPRLLDEILSTRIMIKQAMKKLTPSQQVLQRIFNARQLALKLIANVTYGYTAAGFSGRMPCAELADSIVQCGRRTLETAISFVNEHPKWNARVVYGDTDSMFVHLKGRSLEEAFRIGKEIASVVTAMNPDPVTLKLEKVYHPCFLLTKKRYVGYSYETPDQGQPTFDAKGIETVRRDTCPAVAKILERSLRLIFEHQDINKVKSYLQRQWTRILSGKVSLQDFIFAKEVRLGTYSSRASSLPPSAIVATKAMAIDPRAEPRYGERVPYVVIHGEPGARLIDMVVDPYELLKIDSPCRLNDLFYINKQIIPALQRVFGLVGADLNRWFSEMPRPVRPTAAKRLSYASHSVSSGDSMVRYSKKAQAKSRIDTYYASKHCTLCGSLIQRLDHLCDDCSNKEALLATVLAGKTSKLEREMQHLAAICRHCGGADWILESGVKCTSLACAVFYERRKVQKELRALSVSATDAGFYPPCESELF
ncbi:DNA polymerase zeta catalytic subunit isoform X3 [Ananas comosus]|uniref:DNA polymerase n=1 Tax=Ananas comosus TaxID=4615 RepID=A0A6P5GJV1_ANACO|nr:DNA polymerase zeta catalytic subunit isoform X3 [Ananas comosus]